MGGRIASHYPRHVTRLVISTEERGRGTSQWKEYKDFEFENQFPSIGSPWHCQDKTV